MVEVEADLIWEYLKMVEDPEIPILNVIEMGIVRDLKWDEGNKKWHVVITPTYSGCPAMKAIEEDIIEVLAELQVKNVVVDTVLSPPWTTDWMTDGTKQKLKEYGIAPPPKLSFEHLHPFSIQEKKQLECPFCNSENNHLTSQFGSTACKALYFCDNCHQPFEHFKCH